MTSKTFAWIGPVGPARGTARVYVDGKLVATIDLHAASSSPQHVLFSRRWTNSRSRTIKISVAGTYGHPRIDIDALVWGT